MEVIDKATKVFGDIEHSDATAGLQDSPLVSTSSSDSGRLLGLDDLPDGAGTPLGESTSQPF